MKRALITIAIALLALPAAASANTITVSPGQSVGAAVNSAGDNDVVHVLPGLYQEDPITVAHKIRIEGEPGTIITNRSTDATKPLFTVTADGATIATLTAASTAGQVIVVNTGGLRVLDALVIQAAGAAPALQLNGAGASSVIGSSVAAVDPHADAVAIESATAGDKQLTIDSSILSGGASAASLRAETSNSVTALNTGNVTVQAVHTTLAGAAAAITTKVTPFALGTPGTITVGVDRSILRGTVADGVTVTNSDQTTNNGIFVSAAARNFHLRADATGDIDHGGPAVSGESATDVDGQPRVVGAASDLGADEFVNQAPTARLAAPAAASTPNATTLDASASTDPEAASGGGIANYHFEFGDGTSVDSRTPVVTHVYAKPGTYTATATVTDAQGLASAPSAAVQAVVNDGIAPSAKILSPRNGKRLRLRGPIRFSGTASDDIAVSAVGLTLQRVGTKKVTKIRVHFAQGIWSYRASRKKLRLRRGRYVLKAYAVDSAGNVSKPAGVSFTLK
jgi:PKD repeat protein